MKHYIKNSITFLLLSFSAMAQAPDTLWTKTFNESSYDIFYSVRQTSDGGYIMTGQTEADDPNSDVWVVKTDENGSQVWNRTYGSAINSYDVGFSVKQTSDGGYVIAGRTATGGFGSEDFYLLKLNNGGDLQWEKTFGSTGPDGALSVCQTFDGGYIIAGSAAFSTVPPYGSDIYIVKTDSTGNMQWDFEFGVNNGRPDFASCIQQTADGGYIVAGSVINNGNDNDSYIMKIDGSGILQWDYEIGISTKKDEFYSVDQTNDGGYVFTGYSFNDITRDDVRLVKTNSNGVLEWEKTFNGNSNSFERGREVKQTSDGGYVIVSGNSGSGSADALLIKTDESGNLEWDKSIGKADFGETGWSVDQTTDDGYILAGYSNGNNNYSGLLIRIEGENNLVAWSNANGGVFSEGSNWVGGSSPDETQIALFDSSYYSTSQTNNFQPLTITFNDLTTTSGLTVAQSQILFDLQQHSYEVSELEIGGGLDFPEESQLEIINGVLGTTNNLDIGVGNRPGQLIVSTGGILEVANATSQPLLQVGSGDCGGGDCARLIIQDGGKVFSNGVEVSNNGAQATLVIDGFGSELNDSLFTVIAHSGVASFDIINGGFFSGKKLFASQSNNSEAVISVQGEDSKIFIDEFLYLGFSGNGTLNITNRAEVEIFDRTILGAEPNSTGELFVEGSGSKFTTNKLIVGDFGSGGFTVSDSATATINQNVMVPNNSNGIGSILIDGDGSNLEISGDIKIGFSGVGFVRLTNQGVLTVNSIQLGPLGSIDVSGGIVYVGGSSPFVSFKPLVVKDDNTIVGGSIFVDTLLLSENSELLTSAVEFGEGGYLGGEGTFNFEVINSGGLNPGDSIGTAGILTIDANYTQLSNGTLFIELGGSIQGEQYDHLNVTGDVILSGTLSIKKINGYHSFVGETFEIITASSVSGAFDNVTGDGIEVSVIYGSSSVTITVLATSVEDEETIPAEYFLSQNYPNPFNPSTKISWQSPVGSWQTLKVYDMLGREVATLVDEYKPAGKFEVEFDASHLSSGIYFYSLQASSYTQTKKLVLMK